jgi:hypothetical protein
MKDENRGADKQGSGFIIECHGGERLVVDEKDAQWLSQHVDFFKNVLLKHGSSDSADLILRKHDWSLETSRRLIAYLKLKKIQFSIADLPRIVDFVLATSQILTGAYIHYPLPLGNPELRLEPKLVACLAGTLNQEINNYVLKTRLSGYIWELLLCKGMILFPISSHKLMFEFPKSKVFENELKVIKQRMLSSMTFRVFTPINVETAVKRTCQIMHLIYLKHASKKKRRIHPKIDDGNDEEISILIPLREYQTASLRQKQKKMMLHVFTSETFCWPEAGQIFKESLSSSKESTEKLVDKVSTTSGTRGSVHQPGKSAQEYSTFVGTFTQLKLCLDQIEKELSSEENEVEFPSSEKCSLCVTAPTSSTLKHMIRASFFCAERPGILEVDYLNNAFYIRKSIGDLKQVLAYLINPEENLGTSFLTEAFTLEERCKH